MAHGNEIVLSSPMRGIKFEGILGPNASTTTKPGTWMTVVPSVNPLSDGSFQWEPYCSTAGVSGDQRMPCILLPDSLLGQTAGTAYALGARCHLYIPAIGELINMLVLDVTGSAPHNIGDLLIPQAGTGVLIDTAGTGALGAAPFVVMEQIINPTLATAVLAMCQYTGY